ncbi:MAG: hypothetical protein AAF682_19320 [Planctomycetota bacterium]
MKHIDFKRTLAFALPLALIVGAATPQEGPDPQEGQEAEEEEQGPRLPELFPEQNDPQDELAKLFSQVERNLMRIDTILNDAGAGDIALDEVDASGLDDLLRDTKQNSQSVIDDIDRILEIAQQQGGGSMSQAMQEPSDGESPLDQQRDRGPRDREQTPDQPGEQPNQGQEQQQGGEKPDSPAGSEDPGQTRPGDPHNPESGDPFRVDQDAEEWGMLPARTREIFRNEGSDDLPVQYRDWIDAYYRRLNRDNR